MDGGVAYEQGQNPWANRNIHTERHDRADLLSGTDLSGQDDIVADVLLDLARQETQPRTERLARAIIEGLENKGAPLNRRPYRAAAFSVLKAADIPSVLVEIGFLSSVFMPKRSVGRM